MIAAPVEAYTPKAELTDDYRCFILDAEFPRDTFLTATRIVPDDSAVTCLDPVVGAEACRAPLADTCGIVAPE